MCFCAKAKDVSLPRPLPHPLLQNKGGAEGVVDNCRDNDIFHFDVESQEDVLDQLMGKRPSGNLAVDLPDQGRGFVKANEDDKSFFLIAKKDRRPIGRWADDPLNLHRMETHDLPAWI